MNTLESYRETYNGLSDDELVRLYQGIDDLQELAQIALREELSSRGYDRAKLVESCEQLKRLDTAAGLELPNLAVTHGIGRKIFGRKNVSISENGQMEEYDATLWFVLFWCPAIPIASSRIRRKRQSWWQRFAADEPAAVVRYPRDWNQIAATWIKTALIIVVAYVSLHLVISPPRFRRHRSVLYTHVGSAPWLRVSAVN